MCIKNLGFYQRVIYVFLNAQLVEDYSVIISNAFPHHVSALETLRNRYIYYTKKYITWVCKFLGHSFYREAGV